jgi:hypothetical protein
MTVSAGASVGKSGVGFAYQRGQLRLERLWVDPVFEEIEGSAVHRDSVVLVFDFCSE